MFIEAFAMNKCMLRSRTPCLGSQREHVQLGTMRVCSNCVWAASIYLVRNSTFACAHPGVPRNLVPTKHTTTDHQLSSCSASGTTEGACLRSAWLRQKSRVLRTKTG